MWLGAQAEFLNRDLHILFIEVWKCWYQDLMNKSELEGRESTLRGQNRMSIRTDGTVDKVLPPQI